MRRRITEGNIAMCIYFLVKAAPTYIKEIELVFTIRRHSFLSSERVFGVIEKKLRKISEITNPNTYIDFLNERGTVTKLADCGVKSWKEVAKHYLKGVQSWHFKFSIARRITIEKNGDQITVRDENYNSNVGQARSILKREKR